MPTTNVMEALEHLASIDLIDLCNEAKIERCRATRDLSSCGRYVQHVLNSCGHASLCAECSQRCDACPICRTSIPNNGTRLRLRLYYKCIEAGLISKRHDERFQDKDVSGGHGMADIQRLYSLFDVALENNLVSLICHYVTDVCMDENAVSSDPVLAFLLDEVVVKDWCKQTFKKTINVLQGKYCLGAEEMKLNLCTFQKLASQLTGISNVLEVMVSSFKETFSGPTDDLHHLLESTLKAKQHLEIMIWCIRHQFLENVQSCYPNRDTWIIRFHERKAAAVKRAWPDISSCTEQSFGSKAKLFIEEAIVNLGIEQSNAEEMEEVGISCLQDENSSLFLQSNIDETNKNEATYYPFENVRVATDILFLHGTSDMVVAKRAIFLYYLFDRYWTRPDEGWRHLVDDFAASFGISRYSVLESFTFYLLDDHMEQAVQEAIHLLSEIAGPETHPKIAQVLLERQCPDAALAVLRYSGRDSFTVNSKSDHDGLPYISLDEAITVIRVRIECGLLTESFMYQRMHCLKVKDFSSKRRSVTSNNSKSDSWVYRLEVLVTEICHLCIRRNLVDRMIELPWNSDEEKILHKCLFGYACQHPASIHGSLLVVFYLQRYRYLEAYRVDRNLQILEQKFLENANEDAVCRTNLISHWRSGLVAKSLELLPEVQKQEAMAESTTDGDLSPSQDVQMPFESDSTNMIPTPVSIFTPSPAKPSLVLQKSTRSFPSKKISPDLPINLSSSISNAELDAGKKAPSVLQHRLLSSLGGPSSQRNSLLDGISSNLYNHNQSGSQSMPLSELKRTVTKSPQKLNGVVEHVEKLPASHLNFTAEDHHVPMDTSYVNGFSLESVARSTRIKNSQNHSSTPRRRGSQEESTSNTWSSGRRDSPVEGSNTRVGSRWRSDESSDDEAEPGLERNIGGGGSMFVDRRRPRFL